MSIPRRVCLLAHGLLRQGVCLLASPRSTRDQPEHWSIDRLPWTATRPVPEPLACAQVCYMGGDPVCHMNRARDERLALCRIGMHTHARWQVARTVRRPPRSRSRDVGSVHSDSSQTFARWSVGLVVRGKRARPRNFDLDRAGSCCETARGVPHRALRKPSECRLVLVTERPSVAESIKLSGSCRTTVPHVLRESEAEPVQPPADIRAEEVPASHDVPADAPGQGRREECRGRPRGRAKRPSGGNVAKAMIAMMKASLQPQQHSRDMAGARCAKWSSPAPTWASCRGDDRPAR